MPSVQKFVENYIELRGNIKELFVRKLIDKSQLAVLIAAEFEDKFLKTVKPNTITVALLRYQSKLLEEFKGTEKIKLINDKNVIKARYPVFWSYYQFHDHKSLVDSLEYFDITEDTLLQVKGSDLIIVDGTTNSLVVDSKMLEIVDEQHFSDLCEISIEFTTEQLTKSGFLYDLTSSLFWKNYAVINISVVGNKVYIYVQESNISKIISVLKHQI